MYKCTDGVIYEVVHAVETKYCLAVETDCIIVVTGYMYCLQFFDFVDAIWTWM